MPETILSSDEHHVYIETSLTDDTEYLRALNGVEEVRVANGPHLMKRFPASRFICDPAAINTRVHAHRSGPSVTVFGMSGYSTLTGERCAQLEIEPGEYEALVSSCYAGALQHVQHTLPAAARLRIVDGAADIGIDKLARHVAMQLGIDVLSFNCPEYLWWVDNAAEGQPVCVCADKDTYAHTYINALDILFAANGGPVSYQKDIYAATQTGGRVRVIPLDALRALGARTRAYTDDGKVLDAIAALAHSFPSMSVYPIEVEQAADKYEAIRRYLGEMLTGLIRPTLPIELRYPNPATS